MEREIKLSAEKLVESILSLSNDETICLLDSCGVSFLDSRFLIVGIDPIETFEITENSPSKMLGIIDRQFSKKNLAFIFTLSYDFGLKLENITPHGENSFKVIEPDVFLAAFDCLIIHDYKTKKTKFVGSEKKFSQIEDKIFAKPKGSLNFDSEIKEKSATTSNFTRDEYLLLIEKIKQYIKRGDTYQTNLTQQFQASLAESVTPARIFHRLRTNHPAPFAAFIKRKDDFVVSISPERFFRIENLDSPSNRRIIKTAPIKGTRPRSDNPIRDRQLKNELLESEKDRAENTMIVDLLRNDIGKICRFGTVKVEKLCELEEHPTFFHLVSTVEGELEKQTKFSEIIKAVFPCGSITGAPKIRTMQIISEIEKTNRGLSMGAIGFCDFDKTIDLSVAIRTMVIRHGKAVFNVGGGIVADSNPQQEYEETLVKATAILNAINGDLKI